MTYCTVHFPENSILRIFNHDETEGFKGLAVLVPKGYIRLQHKSWSVQVPTEVVNIHALVPSGLKLPFTRYSEKPHTYFRFEHQELKRTSVLDVLGVRQGAELHKQLFDNYTMYELQDNRNAKERDLVAPHQYLGRYPVSDLVERMHKKNRHALWQIYPAGTTFYASGEVGIKHELRELLDQKRRRALVIYSLALLIFAWLAQECIRKV